MEDQAGEMLHYIFPPRHTCHLTGVVPSPSRGDPSIYTYSQTHGHGKQNRGGWGMQKASYRFVREVTERGR